MLEPKPGIQATQDPEKQCLHQLQYRQCYYEKVPGSDYCAMHGGMAAVRKARKDAMYEFNKNKFLQNLANERMPVFSKGKNKYDLSQELGILRICLEQILNKCDNELILQQHNPQISKTIEQITKLIESSLKLDQKLGELVSKGEMIEIASSLVGVIQKHIQDPNKVKEIVEGFEKVLDARFIQDGAS